MFVDPTSAELRLDRRYDRKVKGGTEPPASVERYVERTEDVSSQDHSVNLRIGEMATGWDRKYRESRLEPGDEVSVFGTVRSGTDASAATGVHAALGADESPPFLVSGRSPLRTAVYYGARGFGAFALGGVAIAADVFLLWSKLA